jgi:hypothetical protein
LIVAWILINATAITSPEKGQTCEDMKCYCIHNHNSLFTAVQYSYTSSMSMQEITFSRIRRNILQTSCYLSKQFHVIISNIFFYLEIRWAMDQSWQQCKDVTFISPFFINCMQVFISHFYHYIHLIWKIW